MTVPTCSNCNRLMVKVMVCGPLRANGQREVWLAQYRCARCGNKKPCEDS